jgi:hypothetical protein
MFCGFKGTLSDHKNVNGGSPDVIKAVIVPVSPVPQVVGYNEKLILDEIGIVTFPVCVQPFESVTVYP